MAPSSLQVNTNQLLPWATIDEVEKESLEVDVVWLCPLRNVHLQPLHTDLGLINRPKVPSGHTGKGLGSAQKLASHCEAQKLNWD